MQVNRVNQSNQQTNFKSIYSEVKPNHWKDLITGEEVSAEALRAVLQDSKEHTGLVLEGIGLLGKERAFEFLDTVRMFLTGGHSVEFKNQTSTAGQRSYLRAYLPFTYGRNGGDSLISVVDAKSFVG